MSRQPHSIVTGGAGFIGSHLVERLLASGRRVVVIDDCSTGSLDNLARVEKNPALRVIVGKVSDCAELPALMESADAVYHLAAVVGVELVMDSFIRTIETNLDETQIMLAAAARHRVPFLLTSTSEVYGKSQKETFSEEDDLLIGPPHLGRWSYACSKLMDEFLALAYSQERGLPVTVARLFNTVGPRQTGRFGMVLPRFIAAAKKGETLRVYGDGRQTRCFCYVDDTVEALVRLHQAPSAVGGVVNVGGGEEISMLDLANLVVRILGSRSRIELVPYERAYAPGFEDMLRRRPDIAKLERLTGFRPGTALSEIITRTAAVF